MKRLRVKLPRARLDLLLVDQMTAAHESQPDMKVVKVQRLPRARWIRICHRSSNRCPGCSGVVSILFASKEERAEGARTRPRCCAGAGRGALYAPPARPKPLAGLV